jgi:hypothetical protein
LIGGKVALGLAGREQIEEIWFGPAARLAPALVDYVPDQRHPALPKASPAEVTGCGGL